MRLGILLLSLLLVGCMAEPKHEMAEQKHELAKCDDEAQDTFRAANLEVPEIAEHIRLCMRAAGYEPRAGAAGCADPAGLVNNPSCYQPAAR